MPSRTMLLPLMLSRLCRVSVSGALPSRDVPEDVWHGASPLFSSSFNCFDFGVSALEAPIFLPGVAMLWFEISTCSGAQHDMKSRIY